MLRIISCSKSFAFQMCYFRRRFLSESCLTSWKGLLQNFASNRLSAVLFIVRHNSALIWENICEVKNNFGEAFQFTFLRWIRNIFIDFILQGKILIFLSFFMMKEKLDKNINRVRLNNKLSDFHFSVWKHFLIKLCVFVHFMSVILFILCIIFK